MLSFSPNIKLSGKYSKLGSLLPTPDNIACVPDGETTTGILLLRSLRSKILEDTKFTSTILPAKYPSFNTGIPNFIPALLPLLIITEFKKGLFLSKITFAFTTE